MQMRPVHLENKALKSKVQEMFHLSSVLWPFLSVKQVFSLLICGSAAYEFRFFKDGSNPLSFYLQQHKQPLDATYLLCSYLE